MSAKNALAWIGRARIDKYFMEERCPYSKRRKFKTGNIKKLVGAMLIGVIGFIIFAGDGAEKVNEKTETVSVRAGDLPTPGTASVQSGDGGISMGVPSQAGSFGGISIGASVSAPAASPRQYGASQIVNSDGAGGFGLPMGTTAVARLMNTVLSSNSAQPAIAEVMEDVVWKNSVLIPAGAHAIGAASFDDAAKRLQIRFNTFVYPDGDQHPAQTIALLNDGSSGLAGDYHSGAAQKEIGRFLGNFVGGFADGMKEREAQGLSGMTYEPGSIKNGILNGIAVSALDQAKSFSEGMQNVKPYLEVPSGMSFLLYFEKEYSP